MTKILHIEASGRRDGSVSRKLGLKLIDRLKDLHPDHELTARDISQDMPYIRPDMIEAFYIPPDQRSPEQATAVKFSDDLIDELLAADILVVSAPMYNFTIPASLKSWIDLVVRAGRTFKFRQDGSGADGLVQDKQTYILCASGGTPLGSPVDHFSPYLKTVLGFIGIRSVEFIAAAGTALPDSENRIRSAEEQIEALQAA